MTRDNNTKAAIEVIKKLINYQDDTLIGCFWYGIKSEKLFGVNYQLHNSTPFYYSEQFKKKVRTGSMLYKQIWRKEQDKTPNFYFKGDYINKPRGGIFEFENEGYKVYTGSWINECMYAKENIIREFQLPENNTEFVIDTHWDIGHSWSDEY